jgi:hypothetical protein
MLEDWVNGMLGLKAKKRFLGSGLSPLFRYSIIPFSRKQ